MNTTPMSRRSGYACLAAVFAISLAAVGEGLEPYASGRLPSSDRGARFTIGLPPGWEVVCEGERTRAVPPRSPSRGDPPAYVDVLAIAADEGGSDGLLGEPDGLARWIAAVHREWRVESRERAAIAGAPREVLSCVETGPPRAVARRVLAAHVPAADLHFVLLGAAPGADFAALGPVFRKVFESFEVRP